MLKKFLNINIIFIALIIISGLFALKALIHPGFFTSLDGWHNVARLYHYDQIIKTGQFPPRWSGFLANNYGYPLFVYSYHAPWLMAEPLMLIGINVFDCIKIILILGFILSGIFMFLWIREMFDSWAGLAAAGIYMWAPYRFAKILVGSSVGEATVFMFLPLIFWGIYKISKQQNKQGIIIGSIGFAGSVLSHMMIFPYLSVFILIYTVWAWVISQNKKIFLISLILMGILGLGLSAFYLLPMMVYTGISQSQTLAASFGSIYKNHFVNMSQLIYSKWNFGPIVTSAKDGELSFQLGIAQWLAVGLAFCLIIIFFIPKIFRNIFNFKKLQLGLLVVCLTGLIISLLMMLDISKPVWEIIIKFAVLDYPWRFLANAVFISGILAGIFIASLKKFKAISVMLFIVLMIYSNRNHTRVNQYTDIPLSLYISSEITTNTFNEYLPIWSSVDINKIPASIADKSENTDIKAISRNSSLLELSVYAYKNQEIHVNYLDFPGQTVFMDNKLIQHKRDGQGRIVIPVTGGNHQIRIIYLQTLVMIIGNLLSVVSLFILGVTFCRQKNLFRILPHK